MPILELTAAAISRLGMEVPLSRVDKALKDLWDQDSAKSRASLVNFAIYTEDALALAHNMELLETITAEHACRAILILNNASTTTPVLPPRAFINALCRPYQGQQVVCSEQLAFLLDQGSALQVQNIVFAHLDSDLPLVVWWQGSLTRHFEERLYSTIDTLIIDSSRWDNPAAELEALTTALQSDTADFSVRDLSWTRSHFLRLALAGCFQDPLSREQLPKFNHIAVTHTRGQRCSALLLGAYVAERLGGRVSNGSDALTFKRDGNSPIQIELTEVGDGSALQGLTLSGEGVKVHVSRDGDSKYVRVCSSCPNHEHEELYPADVETEAELIIEQLSRSGGKTLYAGMISTLRQLV